jgi:Chaperone of endosialidase
MPAEDLVLNVRQISGYTPTSIAPPSATLLMQLAGLGSAYASISPADLVATALQSGGDMFIGGKLSVQALSGGSAQFSNASVNKLWAQKANVADFNATCGTINCVPIATANDILTAFNSVVTSFNLRTGAITLTLADITAAGGAPIASPAFSGAPSAPTAPLGTSTGQLATTAFVQDAVASSVTGVVSFNGRAGAVTLQAADVTGVGGALLASPAFTGTPSAPTAAPGTNSSQLATTAFVAAAIAAAGQSGVVTFNGRAGAVTLLANDISAAGGAVIASPAFTGSPTAPTPPPGDNSLRLATTAFVAAAIAGVTGFAPIASPAFTGVPTAPTASAGTNTTQLATTAFVQAEITAVGAGVVTFNGRSGAVTLGINDVTGAGGAPLASPAFTGAPTAPTAGPGNSTQQLATTAFVSAAIAAAASTTVPLMNGTAAIGTATTYARANHVHPTDTSLAPLSGAAFTGGVSTPTLTATNATVSNTLTAEAATVNSTLTAGAGVFSNTLTIQTNCGVYWTAPLGSIFQNFNVSTYLQLDNGGVFAFVGSPNAVKAGGGPWIASSDARIKTVQRDYTAGLDEVIALRPVVYTFKGNDRAVSADTPSPHAFVAAAATEFVGLVAQEVETVFPGMVIRQAGYIDGRAVDDLRLLDANELIYAVVNAIKTLTSRLDALEAT